MSKALYKQYTKPELEKIIKRCLSWTEVLEALGYNSNTGSSHKRVKEYVDRLGIDYSHFKANKTRLSFDEIFCPNSKAGHTTLRERVKQDNLIPYKCAICGMDPVWQGKPLTLILDHENGIKNWNTLDNLRFVCPNCNQQLWTTGYKGYEYNEETGKKEKVKIEKQKIFTKKELAKQEELKEKYGITRNKLKRDLRTKRFVKIGEKYGVSDNAIRKWCKAFALPYLASEIKGYTDAEWEKI